MVLNGPNGPYWLKRPPIAPIIQSGGLGLARYGPDLDHFGAFHRLQSNESLESSGWNQPVSPEWP